jgi:lipoprotein-anchoring transpeptidase ErfK/SrfK
MVSRRAFLLALAATPLAGCASAPPPAPVVYAENDPRAWYVGSIPDDPHEIPIVDPNRIKPEHVRQVVDYAGPERPGTIVVDIDEKFLYLVQEGGTAIRYGIGVGREGFSWRGVATVGRKAPWPDWRPTANILRRKPDLPLHMVGGLENPLGARALYLHQNGRDTLFRIHGTNEPWSIGTEGTSGCVRLLNQDIVDLYERVPVGATVYVKRNGRYRV